VEAEIERLTALLESYDQLNGVVNTAKPEDRKYPVSGAVKPKSDLVPAKEAVTAKTRELYAAQGALAGAKQKVD